MKNTKIIKKTVMLEELDKLITKLHDNDDYLERSVKEFEDIGLENLSTWDAETYHDNKARIEAVAKLHEYLEKLI